MALFSDNITIKYQHDIERDFFLQAIDPAAGLHGLFRGEMAMLSNDEGIALFGVNGNNEAVQILPDLGELPGVDIENPQAGHVLVYNQDQDYANTNPDYIGRPLNKWINVPAPPPDLSASSIFELRDTALKRDSGSQIPPSRGETLTFEPNNYTPGGGLWVPGKGVSNAILTDFNDVGLIGTPVDGQTLLWNATAERWQNGFYPEGLDDLQDVDISTVLPIDGDVLLYDESRSKWVPGAVAGGNANVEIIEDESNLPVAELTTLGVSQPEGNFFWNQESGTNKWGQAIVSGDVQFSDFKDIDLTDIKEGQTLRWTHIDGAWKFIPADYVPAGMLFAYPRTKKTDLAARYTTISTWGEEGARHICPTNEFHAADGPSPDSVVGLGMFGTSESELGIHVSYDYRNNDRSVDSFYYGVLKFPEDLQPEGPNNLLGVRPVTPAGSVPWNPVFNENGRGRYYHIRVWLNFSTFDDSCTIFDYGSLKLSYDSGQLVLESYYSGDPSPYTQRWLIPGGLSTGQWFFLAVGRNNTQFEAYIDGQACTEASGSTTAPEFDSFLPVDFTSAALPIIGEGFKGYMSQPTLCNVNVSYVGLSSTKDIYLENTWPIGGVTGQLVKITIEGEDPLVRIITNHYNEASWGILDDFSKFSSFGTSTEFKYLADVDSDSFPFSNNDQDNRFVYWDAELGKFVGKTSLSGLELDYQLRFAEDVEMVTRAGFGPQNGSYLTYDTDELKFYLTNDNNMFVIDDAEDVNTDGVQDNDILIWNEVAGEWQPGAAPNAVSGDLGDLNDVIVDPAIVAEGHTLLYSEANQTWTTGPVPTTGSDTLSGMDDVDPTGVQNNDVLAYNSASGNWEAVGGINPKLIDDLVDVDTTSRPPRDGQTLVWGGINWVPGNYYRGGASFAADLSDFNVNNPRQGQVLSWDGNYWANKEAHAGRGDGGDFDRGYVMTSFTSGVWGGGDWDTETPDLPMEMMSQEVFQGGGDFF